MAAGLWIVVGGGLLAVVDVGLRWLGLAARRICGGWWRISPDLWWLVEDLVGSVVAGGGSRRICGGWWRISPDLWWLVEYLAGSVVAGGGSRRICGGWWWLVREHQLKADPTYSCQWSEHREIERGLKKLKTTQIGVEGREIWRGGDGVSGDRVHLILESVFFQF